MNDIAIVGLGVMGANFAKNVCSRGFGVGCYDSDAAKRASLKSGAKDRTPEVFDSLPKLLDSLVKPRRVLLLVPDGAVDSVIDDLEGLLKPGEILIDAGNSHFAETNRRHDRLAAAGIQFVGMGVSGGAEGALRGPSLMPGGSKEAFEVLEPMLRAVAARNDDGEACVAYMGPRGAGHYVKMLHNAIEYGDMQLIAETYDLLRYGVGLEIREIAALFREWNEGELKSYLVEITSRVLDALDPETGRPLVDLIVDEAEQKGTGKWASQESFNIGGLLSIVNAAVDCRLVSARKEERVFASRVLQGPVTTFDGDKPSFLLSVRDALYASKVACYCQGFALLQFASSKHGYDLNLPEVARIWTGGCIIRARLLSQIQTAATRSGNLPNLLLDESIRDMVHSRQGAWREVAGSAVRLGIPMPTLLASLSYFDMYRRSRLPANLTQAQRDYFGMHGYRRQDREGHLHADWDLYHLIYENDGGVTRATVVPKFGASVLSFTYQPASFDKALPVLEPVDLATFMAKPTSYGIPLLAPTPGRVGTNQNRIFKYRGTEYKAEHERHGFLRHRSWKVVARTPESLTCEINVQESTAEPDAKAGTFPAFKFRATYDIRVGPRTLTCRLTIRNTASYTQPISAGWHPYLARNGPCKLYFPAGSMWELDGHKEPVPTGQLLRQGDRFKKVVDLTEQDHWDDVFTDFVDSDGMVSCWTEQGEQMSQNGKLVSMFARRFVNVKSRAGGDGVTPIRHIQLYTPENRNAISIEPLSSPPNAINLLAAGKPGVDVCELEPGREVIFEMTIGVSLRPETSA